MTNFDPKITNNLNQFLHKLDPASKQKNGTQGSSQLTSLNAQIDISEYRSLSAGEKISSVMFKSASMNLDATFKLDNGTRVDLSMNIEVSVKTKATTAASEAYGKNIDLEDYFSPEKTAKRIVDFAGNFFGAFQANHADEEGETQVNEFMELATAAIEKGFGEAADYLGALFGEQAEETKTLVSDHMDALKQRLLDSLNKLPPNIEEIPFFEEPDSTEEA